MARSRTLHTVAASPPGGPAAEVAVPSDAPVGELIGELSRALGWDPEGVRLATPNLAVYGRPNVLSELGFERRTQDQRRRTVVEVLPGAGAIARLTCGGQAADLVVTVIAVAADPSEYGGTPCGAFQYSDEATPGGEDEG